MKGKNIFILVVIAVIAMFIIPYITGAASGGLFDKLSSTGNRVTCSIVVSNPALSDNYKLDKVECVTKESLVCEPFSFATMSWLRSNDQASVILSSTGVQSKTFSIDLTENLASTSQKTLETSYCVPKSSTQVQVAVADKDNQVKDTKEMSV